MKAFFLPLFRQQAVLIKKLSRVVITLVIVLCAIVAIFRVWAFYTESPWTRDAKFTADVVAIAPDVSGLLSDVRVTDNQLVNKGDVLFVIDQPRYHQAVAQAEADVAYYQALVLRPKNPPKGGSFPFAGSKYGDHASGLRCRQQHLPRPHQKHVL